MSATATLRRDEETTPLQEPSIGKDLLELLSSAMYENPLTLYREYIQNAADSIDQARLSGALADDEGSIEILIDPAGRNVRIRDNGAGIPENEFLSRMRSIGSSVKRGTEARGFRGVGRLSGLAYAQKVTFRSRSSAAEVVQQISWDCRKVRAGLKDSRQSALSDFIREVSEITELDGDWPDRFFETELSGIVRLGDDRLVRPETVSDYIAQVAPVPFAPEFSYGRAIDSWIGFSGRTKHLSISINQQEPIFRPHRDVVQPDNKPPIHIRELETFEVPGVDGGIAARGWIAHHDYHGAVPIGDLKGLRVRAGDIQVGSATLLEDIFPEARFASWAIGEVHIQDARIIPNGRRDGFEHNIHYANLLNHLAPRAREIAKRCREQSSVRQRRRAFDTQEAAADQLICVLEQQTLPSGARVGLLTKISNQIEALAKIASGISTEGADAMHDRVSAQRERLLAISEAQGDEPLQHLSGDGRELLEKIITVIYEHSKDHASAKRLVDQILLSVS